MSEDQYKTEFTSYILSYLMGTAPNPSGGLVERTAKGIRGRLMELDRRMPPRELPEKYVDRCRWCGAHGIGKIQPLRTICRARLARGSCVHWESGMEVWAPFTGLDEYVDEKTFEVKRRPTEIS